jgi:glycosidase
VVTDADLVLGRINPGRFLGGKMQLDLAAAERAIEAKVASAKQIARKGTALAAPPRRSKLSELSRSLSAPLTALDTGGVEWSYRNVPNCERGALVLGERVDFADGPEISLRVLRPRGAEGLDPESVRVSLGGADRTTDTEASADAVWVSLRGLDRGKHRVEVTANDTSGRPLEPFSAPFWVDAEPFRWEDAVVYQVMVDRFAGEGGAPLEAPQRPGLRAGGRLSGVRSAVESGALTAMGVNALWLSPLYDNPEVERPGIGGGPEPYVGYHGYWPAAPREVEPELGDAAELDALVAAAHARGMRVLLDVVPNHVDVTSPIYRDSPRWFSDAPCLCGGATCPWTTHIETCWFTAYMPDINFAAPGALDAQVEDALWWMDRFNLDGLRVDAVPMMPRLVVRHLADRVRARFEGLRERHFLLGETYTGAGGQDWIRWYLGPHGLDGQFDYPTLWALRDTLAQDRAPLSALAATFDAGQQAWAGSASVMGMTIGNHDVPRFASEAGGGARGQARAALAHAAVFTLPGMPSVYYGDEVGLAGGRDPDNRRMMPLDSALTANHRELLGRVQAIGTARAASEALRRGVRRTLYRSGDLYVYGLASAPGKAAIVAMNKGGQQTVQVDLPAEWALTGTLTDSLGGSRTAAVASNRISLTLNSWEYVILEP